MMQCQHIFSGDLKSADVVLNSIIPLHGILQIALPLLTRSCI